MSDERRRDAVVIAGVLVAAMVLAYVTGVVMRAFSLWGGVK